MAEKPTRRKAFNFLRSYFDVLNELENNEDKINFLMSIINKQFLDENPKELSFIVNLCYQSQKHAIESSVKGWQRANKDTPITDPTTNPTTDIVRHPKEEEEKEEVQEKEKVEYTIPAYEDFYNYAFEKSNELQIDLCETKLKSKFLAWKENDWKTGGGRSKKIKNWKTTLLNTLPYLRKEKGSAQKEQSITEQALEAYHNNPYRS